MSLYYKPTGQTVILSENATRVLERRYLKHNENGEVVESPGELFWRVALAVAKADLNFDPNADIEARCKSFNKMMSSLDFLPNSPTLMNAGRELGQLSACFVLPIEDSIESIFDTVKHTAIIHQTGGGTGFSFSRLRPKNDRVKSTMGTSSGPVSFMRVFDAVTETIKQGGTRRGANIGVLRVDHPDILDFITCKTTDKSLNNFNISVGITDAFMHAVETDSTYELINPRTRKPVKTLSARRVFDLLVQGAWRNGEPGVVFLDRLNQHNPTPLLGDIESTNPCGEQPLLPYESCNLGSINVGRFVNNRSVDWDRLRQTVHTAVHFLDNVIEVNCYSLPEIERLTKGNRKIGLGVMGYADMLIRLQIPYCSEQALNQAETLMSFIQREARVASAKLADERGAFPNYKGSIYAQSNVRPLRNATLTTIAPTGTLSILASCSSGIEPLFAVAFIRRVMDNDELVEVNEDFLHIAQSEGFYSEELMQKVACKGSIINIREVPEKYRRLFSTSHDISASWHIRTQAAFQKYTDNAVSKTVNLHNQATEAHVAEVYCLAYTLGCKGVTVYRDKSREEQVLNIEDKNASKRKTFQEKQISASSSYLMPRERPQVVYGSTRKMKTGCGNLYVTINEDDKGIFEVFTAIGKAGGCAASQSEAIGRLISLSLRAGVDPDAIIRQLSGVRCPFPAWKDGETILSCADAIARALKSYLAEKNSNPNKTNKSNKNIKQAKRVQGVSNNAQSSNCEPSSAILICPECGNSIVEHVEGCVLCPQCGFSKC